MNQRTRQYLSKIPYPDRKEGRPGEIELRGITATVSEDIYYDLWALAHKTGRPFSHHVERALRFYLDAMGIEG